MEFVNDAALPKQFHDRLTEVYKKQGLVIPFGPERPISLCSKVSKILPVMVLNGDKIVAAGIFPYDENCIYFWGGAAYPEDYRYHPNELMHWAVIKYAVNNNIKCYNMCGGTSQFKNKFGGEDIGFISYSMSFLPFLARARTLYKKLHFLTG